MDFAKIPHPLPGMLPMEEFWDVDCGLYDNSCDLIWLQLRQIHVFSLKASQFDLFVSLAFFVPWDCCWLTGVIFFFDFFDSRRVQAPHAVRHLCRKIS